MSLASLRRKKTLGCLSMVAAFWLLLTILWHFTSRLIGNGLHLQVRFPILSQTDWLPGSKVFVEEKLTEFAIQWKFQDDLKCMESLKAEFWTHPYAPIHFLPPSDQLLSPITKQHTKSCSRKVENLRVILCLNRKSADDRRNAIRQTFANFSRFNLKSNWTIIFLVGKPENDTETRSLEEENEHFGDLLIANVSEGYYLINLKMMVGYKYMSCFCGHADYVIKSDDDNYIRTNFLDRLITEKQLKLDEGRKSQKIKTNGNSLQIPPEEEPKPKRGVYMGACGGFKVQREGKWKVSYAEYNKTGYPPYCSGPLFVLSMDVVDEISKECPNHCIGQDPRNFTENKKEFCLWRFEDAFVGSCIFYTLKNVKKTTYGNERKHVGRKTYWNATPYDKHVVVTGLKTLDELFAAHEFYERMNLTGSRTEQTLQNSISVA